MMISTNPAKVGGRPRRDGGGGAALADGELLSRFIDQHDEPAFEELLLRHGPMVLSVCRRSLRNDADVEDAFQATFLVLVHKAASVRPRAMIANWLYGVARKTALKARVMSNRRQAKEQGAAARLKTSAGEPQWHDLQPVLDQELSALPEKYRSAIILCDVEGKTLADAALQIGCPLGTVGTRVARGRQILSRRLTRRGVTPAAGIVAALFAQGTAHAAVSRTLAMRTTAAASSVIGSATASHVAVSARVAGLTAAVLRAMMVARIKIAMAVLLVLSFIMYVGVTWAQPSPVTDGRAARRRFRSDEERMQDTWALHSLAVAGREIPRERFREAAEWTIDGDRITATVAGTQIASFRIDEGNSPKEIAIDFRPEATAWGFPGTRCVGTYKFEKRLLTISIADAVEWPRNRAKDFASRGGDRPVSQFVLQRKRTVRAGLGTVDSPVASK